MLWIVCTALFVTLSLSKDMCQIYPERCRGHMNKARAQMPQFDVADVRALKHKLAKNNNYTVNFKLGLALFFFNVIKKGHGSSRNW